MNTLKLSIITINFNNLEGLKKTLISVINQTYKSFEYIIIDGGSTDGSKEYLEQYSNILTYWTSENDGGVYEAMNKGIAKAKGEYLMFLNSGDYIISPDILSNAFNLIQDSNADVFFGSILIESENGKIISRKYNSSISLTFWKEGTINHQASLIKADLFKEFGLYDLNYPMAADYAFFLKAYMNGKRFEYINTDLVFYALDGISSQNMDKYISQMNEAWRTTVPEFVDQMRIENLRFKDMMKFKVMKIALKINTIYQKLKRTAK